MEGSNSLVTIFSLLIAAVSVVSMWMIFTKANQAGWKSLIPFLNLWTLCQITGLGALWFVLFFVPILNFFALFMVLHGLSKSFGQGLGFTIGLIFFSIVFMPILAFGPAKYVGPNS